MKHSFLVFPFAVTALACGGATPEPAPTEATSAPAQAMAEPTTAPSSEPAEPPAVVSAEPAMPAPAAAAGGGGTLLGEPFKTRTAIAQKNAAGSGPEDVVVTIYDGDVTCANVATKNMPTARLSAPVKWKKGEKTASLSAYARDAGVGKAINYEKKGHAELAVLEAGDKGRVRVTAKDSGLKVELEGEIDVVRCK